MSLPPQPGAHETPPTLDPAALNAAIASLAPALELLERFHHRNKNQHRLSKWWAQADMLRRHVRKMLRELEDGVAEAERVARANERRRARERERERVSLLKGVLGKAGEPPRRGGRGDGEDGNGVVRKRAEYLRWRLGPGAYLAFTQLTADRQFAHLGLMLLGILAQVDTAVAPFAPPPPKDTTTLVESDEPELGGKAPIFSAADDQGPDTDMGVAVSREETTAPLTGKNNKRPRTEPEEGRRLRAAGRGGGGERGEEGGGGGGDEFDDIFAGLDDDKKRNPKPQKKKTKKRRKGDEFDDIFSGL
ncbi:78fcb27a-5d60-44fc-b333-5564f66bbda6 [Thermothielavioides terrestris]|uniref:78fcb27a-5d60-44fc-b333-5564f66bbda6 n=1 Tax=Thermothielavioides terrestris TaxID=2587410 RepID=A0A3S4AU07_9PEZI|nr:78fcb27a-5d60-44fc-b333-5564f66bbda6 [Thermothielavioides terrestris]